MHMNRVLDYLPIPSNLKLFYARVTASRLTTIYFLIALLHCALQVTFQVAAFKINEYAGRFLAQIISQSNIAQDHALLIQGGELRLCGPDDWASDTDIYQCPVVWEGRLAQQIAGGANGTDDGYGVLAGTSTTSEDILDFFPVFSFRPDPTSAAFATRPTGDLDDLDDDLDDDEPGTVTVTTFVQPSQGVAGGGVRNFRRQGPVEGVSNGTSIVGVQVDNLEIDGTTQSVTLSLDCVEMLLWPRQMIRNTKREDVIFIAFQVWVLSMSIVAVLNESIPHILASLLTHLLSTAWSGYQLYNTDLFRQEFQRSVLDSRRCGDTNLLPGYWQQRNAAEIGVLVINGVSLLAVSFLSWRLVKAFGWQTFKRIGASLDINRVYKIVLTFSIGLQLASFFIVAAMALWLDLLLTSPLGQRASNLVLYQVLAIVTCVLIIPWLCLGWFSVRRETKLWMTVFIVLSSVMIAGWAAMFASNTFRWTFTDWRFFSVMSTASSFLLLVTTVLAVVCLMNFGKGLKRFLKAQEPIPDDATTANHDAYEKDAEKGERVDFPSSRAIPSYTGAFGGGGARAMSPQELSPEYEYPVNSLPYQQQPPYYYSQQQQPPQRQPSNGRDWQVGRQPSNGSTLERTTSRSSEGGAKSYVSAGSHHAPTLTKSQEGSYGSVKKGWVIE